MFRAKYCWIENGERPTKYFFNLEKSKYSKKTISELRLQDDSTMCNKTVILQQIENHQRNLYVSDLTFLKLRMTHSLTMLNSLSFQRTCKKPWRVHLRTKNAKRY